MHRLIVTQFCTLDGIVSDPDGADGTAHGGWAFRHGPAAVAEDKFRLGRVMDDGALLFGRTTWERFARRWPARTTEFASRMNAAAKLVVSHTDLDTSAWANSTQLRGDLRSAVCAELTSRDVVLIGSVSVLRELQAQGLVDEYRILTFPSVVGSGDRLFAGRAVELSCVGVEQVGSAVLTRYAVQR